MLCRKATFGEIACPEKRRRRMKKSKKKSAKNSRFRPGSTGECEAALWFFTGPSGILHENEAPEVYWVAAESLEEALRYVRLRYADFVITDARFLDMIPLLSGSPLD
jgi:hypothetical protein